METIQQSPLPIRVIKVGGSLLTWPLLQSSLPRWLETLPPALNAIIVGGGECIEAMRQLDRIWQLDATTMHWRCVDLLDASWQIACELWPQFRSFGPQTPRAAASPRLLQNFWSSHGPDCLSKQFPRNDLTYIVRTSTIYGSSCRNLPTHWSTTTDSIAAYLAVELQAAELLLLKSASPSQIGSLLEASHSGLVDDAFPEMAQQVPHISAVHFTTPGFPRTDLLP